MSLDIRDLPRIIDAGWWDTGHVQGIALDPVRRHFYFSFTTALVKTDLAGNLIGYVQGLTGHLGCIDFNEADGRVYGSIEYKHDAIGRGIMRATGRRLPKENAFYIGIFDCEKIGRPGMDAEKDGVMTAVYLPDVVADFEGTGAAGRPHRYGCSGIDGTAFGPAFGTSGGSANGSGAGSASSHLLTVAYGIYGDVGREDNDYQVLLQYDWRKFAAAARPLNQEELHRSGVAAEGKYFVFTGNTTYGIQNLEYDEYTGGWFAAVYRGKKEQYPNYPLFLIDGAAPPAEQPLRGAEPRENGKVLSLKEAGLLHEASGIRGWEFPWGQTGMLSLGNGYFYFSHNRSLPVNGGAKRVEGSEVRLYRWTGEAPAGFALVE